MVSRSCGSTLHEGRADGEVDDEARWSVSHSDELTYAAVRIDQVILANSYYYTTTGLPVRIDQEVEMTDRGEESSPYILQYFRAGYTIT